MGIIVSAEDQEELKRVPKVKQDQKVAKEKLRLITRLMNKKRFIETQTLRLWEYHQKEDFIQNSWILGDNF